VGASNYGGNYSDRQNVHLQTSDRRHSAMAAAPPTYPTYTCSSTRGRWRFIKEFELKCSQLPTTPSYQHQKSELEYPGSRLEVGGVTIVKNRFLARPAAMDRTWLANQVPRHLDQFNIYFRLGTSEQISTSTVRNARVLPISSSYWPWKSRIEHPS